MLLFLFVHLLSLQVVIANYAGLSLQSLPSDIYGTCYNDLCVNVNDISVIRSHSNGSVFFVWNAATTLLVECPSKNSTTGYTNSCEIAVNLSNTSIAHTNAFYIDEENDYMWYCSSAATANLFRCIGSNCTEWYSSSIRTKDKISPSSCSGLAMYNNRSILIQDDKQCITWKCSTSTASDCEIYYDDRASSFSNDCFVKVHVDSIGNLYGMRNSSKDIVMISKNVINGKITDQTWIEASYVAATTSMMLGLTGNYIDFIIDSSDDSIYLLSDARASLGNNGFSGLVKCIGRNVDASTSSTGTNADCKVFIGGPYFDYAYEVDELGNEYTTILVEPVCIDRSNSKNASIIHIFSVDNLLNSNAGITAINLDLLSMNPSVEDEVYLQPGDNFPIFTSTFDSKGNVYYVYDDYYSVYRDTTGIDFPSGIWKCTGKTSKYVNNFNDDYSVRGASGCFKYADNKIVSGNDISSVRSIYALATDDDDNLLFTSYLTGMAYRCSHTDAAALASPTSLPECDAIVMGEAGIDAVALNPATKTIYTGRYYSGEAVCLLHKCKSNGLCKCFEPTWSYKCSQGVDCEAKSAVYKDKLLPDGTSYTVGSINAFSFDSLGNLYIPDDGLDSSVHGYLGVSAVWKCFTQESIAATNGSSIEIVSASLQCSMVLSPANYNQGFLQVSFSTTVLDGYFYTTNYRVTDDKLSITEWNQVLKCSTAGQNDCELAVASTSVIDGRYLDTPVSLSNDGKALYFVDEFNNRIVKHVDAIGTLDIVLSFYLSVTLYGFKSASLSAADTSAVMYAIYKASGVSSDYASIYGYTSESCNQTSSRRMLRSQGYGGLNGGVTWDGRQLNDVTPCDITFVIKYAVDMRSYPQYKEASDDAILYSSIYDTFSTAITDGSFDKLVYGGSLYYVTNDLSDVLIDRQSLKRVSPVAAEASRSSATDQSSLGGLAALVVIPAGAAYYFRGVSTKVAADVMTGAASIVT